MPFNIGPGELIIVLIIALIVVGPGKLPDVGSALGKSIREFRKAAADVKESSLSLDTPAPAAPVAPAPVTTLAPDRRSGAAPVARPPPSRPSPWPSPPPPTPMSVRPRRTGEPADAPTAMAEADTVRDAGVPAPLVTPTRVRQRPPPRRPPRPVRRAAGGRDVAGRSPRRSCATASSGSCIAVAVASIVGFVFGDQIVGDPQGADPGGQAALLHRPRRRVRDQAQDRDRGGHHPRDAGDPVRRCGRSSPPG